MIQRGIIVGVVCAALGATVCSTAVAAWGPPGPRVAFLSTDFKAKKFQVASTGVNGTARRVLVGNGKLPIFFGQTMSWASGGSGFVLGAASYSEPTAVRLFSASSRASRTLTQVSDVEGTTPVLSPDGTQIAFTRTPNGIPTFPPVLFDESSTSAVYIASVKGGKPRRVTQWRAAARQTPSSFSPDGMKLLVTQERLRTSPRMYVLDLLDGSITFLKRRGFEPKFSPDGSSIAFLQVTSPSKSFIGVFRGRPGADVYVTDAAGGELRRLTRSPSLAKHGLSWDPSGSRILFTQSRRRDPLDELFGSNSVVEMNADGTCRRPLLRKPKVQFGSATYQPGPGREAGPIAC